MAEDTGILLESGTNELELLEFVVGSQHYGINVAKISDEETPLGEEGEEGEPDGILGMLKKAANCKVVNADTYLL